MINKLRLSPLRIAATVVTLFVLMGCEEQQAPAHQQPEYDIGYMVIEPRAVELFDTMPGRTLSSYEAEIRPQVGGIILQQLFEGGTMVKRGQPLYQIDPAPFQLSLKQAQSDLRKAVANQTSARNLAGRYQRLVKERAVSRQDYDNAVASYQEAQSAVTSAQAAVDNAKINLGYTRVTSPINGRAGRSNVTEGALVTANQSSPLATVQTYDPMYVDLTASSAELLQFRRDLAQGLITRDRNESKQIKLFLEDGTPYDHLGTILFADVDINETTGSFVLRVSFPNPDQVLLPGLFVRASLPRGVDHDAILVPAKALTRNPKGDAQVSVIDSENKTQVVEVETSYLINHHWLVTKGLKGGEKVIVDGIQFVRPGAPVAKSHEIIAKPQK